MQRRERVRRTHAARVLMLVLLLLGLLARHGMSAWCDGVEQGGGGPGARGHEGCVLAATGDSRKAVCKQLVQLIAAAVLLRCARCGGTGRTQSRRCVRRPCMHLLLLR